MVSQIDYDAYQAKNLDLIKQLLADMGCRPVLFVGSGITKRYLNGPDWIGLLRILASRAGVDDDRFNYLAQKGDNDPIKIGSLISEDVHAWAFGPGRNHFPKEYFEAGVDKDIFIKHLACEVMGELLPNVDHLSPDLAAELESFKLIGPHAVITTNFDTFLETCFADYELVVGEKIIPFSLNIVGEMYKIHGSSSDPKSIVLTAPDYERFTRKRRYISSKIMTYFAEYPVFIFGYGLSDTNVNAILSDLGEALKDKGGLLENVFLVKRISNLDDLPNLQEEHAVGGSDGGSPPLRIRTILTTDFDWIYKALGDTTNPVPVPIGTLRHLAARVVELVRVDVPKNKVEVDFDQVKRLTGDSSELASVLGIGNVESANLQYPYSLTELGKKLGFAGWHKANDLIKVANVHLGYDIKAGDNEFHMAFKVGQQGTPFHKYSEAAFDLLTQMRDEGQH